MIVTCALAWWNETPEDLARCVRGMATVADRVVAVDGAYVRYPGATITSAPEQAEAIRATAQEVGLEAVIHIPDRLWAGQVEKRDFLMRQAAIGSDWIAGVDADFLISGNRLRVRRDLERYGDDVDVVRVVLETPVGRGEYASHWHRKIEEWRSYEFHHFFRALPEIGCERVHWQFRAVKNGEPVWMLGVPDDTRRMLPSVLLRHYHEYRVQHLTLQRSHAQVMASRAFLNDREWIMEQTGQEDDIPGLPPPKLDYENLAAG
jgi:hypothetical protein